MKSQQSGFKQPTADVNRRSIQYVDRGAVWKEIDRLKNLESHHKRMKTILS